MLNGLGIDPRYTWVSKTCMELNQARRAGKITQEMLDYELAKISFEFVDDHRPVAVPLKPQTITMFESLRPADIKDMGHGDFKRKEEIYNQEKRAWLDQRSSIETNNLSNLLWLRKMLECFSKKNHPGVARVQQTIDEYTGAREMIAPRALL